MKFKRLFIILGIVLAFLLALVLILGNSKKNKTPDQAVLIEVDEKKEDKAKKAINDGIVDTLSNMSEQKRMEYYVSGFIKLLEARDIQNAYKVLNEDFKKNYFNNQEAFGEYIKKYFPKETSVKYKNFERLGEIYVFELEIKDILSNKPNDFSCYMVIKENDYNDFELSFSVDSAMKNYTEE